MAERSDKRLSEDSDVAAVQVKEADEADARRFQSLVVSTKKTEEWFSIVKPDLELNWRLPLRRMRFNCPSILWW